MQVSVACDDNGMKALIQCPFCEASITIRQEKSKSWKVSNFSSHIKQRHNDIVPCSDTFQEQPEAQRSCKRKWASSFHENTIEVVQSIPLESTETYEAEYLDCSEQHFDPHDSYIEEQFSEEQEVKHNVYDYEPPTLSDSALQHLDIQPMNYQDYKEQHTNLSSDPLN